ncbi:4Fe-4S binding protein [Aminipila butyrica]|uniref:4Fe-4S binding protein n=1 Tax=Aminipila butyrica TaxID=433296 RepID=A0A858BW65_9FIRM|nr:4Fe-4S binding protein [Aminipila butyrica]QIB70321.1 4Fe-4S binding protein [Aminipila butyrica]
MRQKIRKGMLAYSAVLFPITFIFLSPYIIIVSARMGVISGSGVMFAFLFLSSIVGSRLYCGWLCPGGAVQDMAGYANSRPWFGRFKIRSKYIIWGIWFSVVVFLWIKNGPLEVHFFKMFNGGLAGLLVYAGVASIIYFFSLVTGKRGMCHSICWMAPFMVIGEKTADLLHIPRFRLKADSNACISCGQCDKKCPMSIGVQEMVRKGNMDHTECIACLECVDSCPKKVIRFGVGRQQKKNS